MQSDLGFYLAKHFIGGKKPTLIFFPLEGNIFCSDFAFWAMCFFYPYQTAPNIKDRHQNKPTKTNRKKKKRIQETIV